MTNRHVPIITGIVSFTIGAALVFGFGSWWAWLIGLPFVIFGSASLKMGFTAPDDEIAAMTSFSPLSKQMDERITKRIDDAL